MATRRDWWQYGVRITPLPVMVGFLLGAVLMSVTVIGAAAGVTALGITGVPGLALDVLIPVLVLAGYIQVLRYRYHRGYWL